MKKLALVFLTLLFTGCAGIPDGMQAVKGFEVERYLGKWYEVARLDHSFERGLSQVSAEYSLRNDGDLRVLNRGFNADKGEWSEAEGRAKFLKTPDVGQLKVSFFGPFYGGYNIIELDRDNYDWVMIAGNSRDYLWLLSRQPQLDEAVKQRLVQQAKSLGFAVDTLIWVAQSDQ